MKNALSCQIVNHPKNCTTLIYLIKKINKSVYNFFHLKNFGYYELTFISSSAKMRALNCKYRNEKKATDVISICLWDNTDIITPLLGQIFICLKQIKIQAKQYSYDWKYEFTRMLIHSVLHLLDFHHEENIYVDTYSKLVETTLANQIFEKRKIHD